MKRTSKKTRTYSKECKLKAVTMYLSGEHGGDLQVIRQLDIRSARQLRRWVNLYQTIGGADEKNAGEDPRKKKGK